MANKRLKAKMKHRRNGEGSVSVRKDGYFQASIMKNGKRCFKYALTEKAAYDKLEEMRDKVRHGISLVSGDVTFDELVSSYIDRYAKPYVKPATLKNYQGYSCNYISGSRIGKMKVSRIAADDIQDFVKALVDKGLSGKTIGNIAAFVDSVFAQAMRNHIIMYNPCEGVRLPKKKTKERPLISEEEYANLLNSADTQTMRTAIAVLGEGLRIGELLALQWKDYIEVEGVMVLEINKTLKREYLFDEKQEKRKGTKTEVRLSDTKTDSSVRQVPVLPGVMSQLERLRTEKQVIAEKYGIPISDEDFIIGTVGVNGFGYMTQDKNLST